MCQEISRAVVAVIKMEFVTDVFRAELAVESRGSVLEAELILAAAVEVNG
jgi:hypothetical protein